jgi:putative sterol carrier protein
VDRGGIKMVTEKVDTERIEYILEKLSERCLYKLKVSLEKDACNIDEIIEEWKTRQEEIEAMIKQVEIVQQERFNR